MDYPRVEYDEAISIMENTLEETDDIGIFTDRGWGDDPSIKRVYTIIRDGNGQNPLASISKETFNKLRKNKEIGENILDTFKDRTFHLFRGEAQCKV